MPSDRYLRSCALLSALLGLLATRSWAEPARETEVEALVRAAWFEGLPLDRAAALGAADGERLAEMLSDPAESAHHANILLALGACGCGPAYEAVLRFDAAGQSGGDAVARGARFAVPQAMGLLADRDPRALDWLEAQATQPAPAASDRAGRHRRIAVIEGLAASRSARGTAVLNQLEAAAQSRGDRVMAQRAANASARAQGGPRR